MNEFASDFIRAIYNTLTERYPTGLDPVLIGGPTPAGRYYHFITINTRSKANIEIHVRGTTATIKYGFTSDGTGFQGIELANYTIDLADPGSLDEIARIVSEHYCDELAIGTCPSLTL